MAGSLDTHQHPARSPRPSPLSHRDGALVCGAGGMAPRPGSRDGAAMNTATHHRRPGSATAATNGFWTPHPAQGRRGYLAGNSALAGASAAWKDTLAPEPCCGDREANTRQATNARPSRFRVRPGASTKAEMRAAAWNWPRRHVAPVGMAPEASVRPECKYRELTSRELTRPALTPTKDGTALGCVHSHRQHRGGLPLSVQERNTCASLGASLPTQTAAVARGRSPFC